MSDARSCRSDWISPVWVGFSGMSRAFGFDLVKEEESLRWRSESGI
jgi:hypothetical protein